MTSAPRDPANAGDDAAWNEIISKLHGEVFTEIPDIIASGPEIPKASPNDGNPDIERHPANGPDSWGLSRRNPFQSWPSHTHEDGTQGQAAEDLESDANDPFAFVPPDPPPVRLSRNTKIGWGCVIAGPLIYGGAEAVGLLDDAVQVLSFGLLITGAFLLLRNLPNHQPDEDDSAPV